MRRRFHLKNNNVMNGSLFDYIVNFGTAFEYNMVYRIYIK